MVEIGSRVRLIYDNFDISGRLKSFNASDASKAEWWNLEDVFIADHAERGFANIDSPLPEECRIHSPEYVAVNMTRALVVYTVSKNRSEVSEKA